MVDQGIEQCLVVAIVLDPGVGVRLAPADREAVRAVVRLGPPAVEDREVERAIQERLLARGPARLLRPARVVQPDVDALHELARDVDVVVLDEHDPVREPFLLRQPDDVLH